MTSKLGVYWSVMHRRATDYDYFRRLQPSVFKIMDGGPPDYQFARDHLPNSLVIARDWALSEQHSDMLKDPIATGKRHAQEWHRHADRLGFDRAKTLVLGVNEPRVWDAGVPEALRAYTIALCEEASIFGLRVGAMQLSVGWPNNTGPDTPPNWEPWAGVDNAIRANNGALVLHEYWAGNGPGENWGWWAGRSLKCPWQVPIVIGECGIDMYVKDGSVAHHARGWRGHKASDQYARELADYVGRMSADKRFVGCAVFASDYANGEWVSFDVEPAYNAILATPIPDITPPTESTATMYVTATAGLNLRSAPEGDVLIAIPYAAQVTITGVPSVNGWLRANYAGHSGWLSSAHVSTTKPHTIHLPQVGTPPEVDEPTPHPAGNDWPRIYAFIKRWEGGWADHPSDPGGATMKGVTIGTYTRWRQAHGQPAPTKAELRNISDAEVEAIYRQWYWSESGADSLSWPLNLAVFNIAVNAGPGRAKQFLNESGGNFLLFMAIAIEWYTKIDGWPHFGAAWTRRNADLLREVAK